MTASDWPARSGPAVLDHPIWASLTGPHAHFAEGAGQALRYPAGVAPFVAAAPGADGGLWADVAALVGPAETVAVSGLERSLLDRLPPGWELAAIGEGVQLLATDRVTGEPAPDAVPLGAADVPQMLDLVERTRPGPFLPRTHQLGRYLGIRRGGRLVAMAGERLHPPGYTEISAVCTDPEHRGQGLARRLVLAVADGIRDRGEVPFMHAAAVNEHAIRIYQRLGFELRRRVEFAAVTTPAAPRLAAPQPAG